MDRERIDRTRRALEKQGLDALVCRLPENVLFLSGYWPMAGLSFLLFPRDGDPVCIAPDTEEQEASDDLQGGALRTFPYGTLQAGDLYRSVEGALRDLCRGKSYRRIGFEGSFESVAPGWNAGEPVTVSDTVRRMYASIWGEASLADATDLLRALRVRKTEAEAQRIRRANEIARFGLQAFSDAAAPGRSGIELVAEVEAAVVKRGTGYQGARRVRAFAQVAAGREETALGWRPMEISTTRPLVSGDFALLELGVVADGYWSDRTRTRVAGEATTRQREVFEQVRGAQEAAVAAVRIGIRASAVDGAARAALNEAGLSKEFLHITGHGVGFSYHEPGSFLAPGSDTVLEEGMVFSVEPGVYASRHGGVRLEDNVLVTLHGGEVLGPFDRKLIG